MNILLLTQKRKFYFNSENKVETKDYIWKSLPENTK